MRTIRAALAASFAVLAAAASAHAAGHPLLRRIAAEVSARELHATIARLVGFGARHTLSDTSSDIRGIGAARTAAWPGTPHPRR